jgi:hypothetical protein
MCDERDEQNIEITGEDKKIVSSSYERMKTSTIYYFTRGASAEKIFEYDWWKFFPHIV